MWEELEPWIVLAVCVGLVLLGRALAQRKASRIRQEGRQEAFAAAALQARLSTGHQTVMVDASNGRVRQHSPADDGAADLGAIDYDDGRVSDELGRSVRRRSGLDDRGIGVGDAAVVHPPVYGRWPGDEDVAVVTPAARRLIESSTSSGHCDGCGWPVADHVGDRCP